MEHEHPRTDVGRVTARRAALKAIGAGTAAVWIAPVISTGGAAGAGVSPPPSACVATEAELLAALAAATDGTTIALCAATIPITTEITISTDVTLVSAGPGSSTLSGSGSARLRISSGTTVTLDNLTITGRGIVNDGTLTLTDCVVDGAAAAGASAVTSGGVLTATTTTFKNNAATSGGAISMSAGTLTATNCTFTGNSAANDGGAVHLLSSVATFTNGLFQGNTAATSGGAISATGTSAFSTPGCNFTGNAVDPFSGFGGAVRHAATGLYTVGTASFTANIAGTGTAIFRGSNPINLAGVTLAPGQTVVNP